MIKREVLLLAGAVILAIVVVGSFILFRKSGQSQPVPSAITTQPESPLPTTLTNLQVASIQPNTTQPLITGSQPSFIIKFSTSANPDYLTVSFRSLNEQADQDFNNEPSEFRYSDNNTTLTITPKRSVQFGYLYQILLQAKENNATFYQAKYVVDQPTPTPAPQNNRALIPYLPYETSSFRLSYSELRNIYIFNFKYDQNSPDDISTQYNTAKQAALDFIRSKGIDPNSLIIDWRHS